MPKNIKKCEFSKKESRIPQEPHAARELRFSDYVLSDYNKSSI